MNSHFVFRHRTVAVMGAVFIVAIAMISFHRDRVVHAQSNSKEIESFQSELEQLEAEVNVFLDQRRAVVDQRRTVTRNNQTAPASETITRQRLLQRLSAVEGQIRNLNPTADQTKTLTNTIHVLEEKLLAETKTTGDQTDTSPQAASTSQPDKFTGRLQIYSAQVHPEATGTVAGKIVDTGGIAISGITVFVVTSQGNGFGGTTDGAGNYSVAIAPGTYYVATSNSQGYLDQIYDGQPCLALGCFPNPSNGTAITVNSGSTTANINFTLKKGGALTGKVIDAVTMLPLPNTGISIYDSNGKFLAEFLPDGSANYMTSGLPPGTYYARAFGRNGYISQTYNGINCSGDSCNATAGTPLAVNTSTIPNINFSLVKGGAITGVITDAVTNTPVPSVTVVVFDSAGNEVEQLTSNASGVYSTIEGLTAGSYYLETLAKNTYFGQVYQGIQCAPAQPCVVTNGTAVTVTGTATTSGINFNLQKGGTITGVITDAGTSLPLPFAAFSVFDLTGSFVTGGLSDASGVYTTSKGLATGTYHVSAAAGDAVYLRQTYNGINCAYACVTTLGAPVSVTAGLTTAGINFPLVKGGIISGKITDSSNSPITGVEVDIYDANGSLVFFGFSDPSGNYTSQEGLPAGAYFARTFNSGFIDQLYNGVTCTGDCDVTAGTPIAVNLGANTGNINFTLEAGGTISGKIVDAANNAGLNFTNVEAFDSNGNFAGSGKTTDTTGLYTISGLPAGTYYVETVNPKGLYIDQLYNGIQCAFRACLPTSGTPVTVNAGATTPNINFGLHRGGQISGIVTNGANSVGISDVTVRIYDANGVLVTTSADTLFGFYTAGSLPTGTYFARTSNSLGYLDQLYSGLSCALGCRAASGTPINVIAGSIVNNINFSLQKGGTISGKVTDAVSHAALTNVFVDIYDQSGTFITNGQSDGAGNYVTSGGLPPGEYFAQTSNSQSYLDAIYNGIQCPLQCDPTSGTPITVNAAANTPNVDFALTKGGTITGKVTDANTSAGISSVTIGIYDSTGTLVTSTLTNGAGAYTTVTSLPAGTYFARSSNSLAYVNQIFNGIQCLNACAPTTGTPITVTSGAIVSNINFALQKGGSITGKVIDAASSQPLSGVTVRILDSGGNFVTSGVTNGAGIYTSSLGLPTGVYLAKTSNSLGYIEQLYKNIQCAGCNVTSGTSIPVVLGSQTTSIDFALSKGGTISGTITDAVNHTPIESVSVTLYDGGGHAIAAGTTDAAGHYVTGAGVPTGSYFAATTNGSGYLDEVYDSISCPVGCAVTAGTPISLNAGSNTSNINFALPQTGSAIQFSSPSFTVSETSTSVTITVQRLGNLNGTAEVDFSTSDGTAVQKNDYTPASGTLNFGVGESIKTFGVLITKDAFPESSETVNLALSNVSGNAVLGNPNTAILTITNDPLAPASPNPIDDGRDFVIQHYHDFLGRDPDDAGLLFWATGINNCGNDSACIAVTRINTSAAFFLSIEFQETGGAVIRLQRAAFGRKSNDPVSRITYQELIRDSRKIGNGVIVGQGVWDQLLAQNKQAYAQQVVNGADFVSRYPTSLSADALVDALFASAGVTPTTAERQTAINAFGGGGTPGRVAALQSVADSKSMRQIELGPSFVLMEYFGYLRRNPTDAPDNNDGGYQFWLAKLNSFGGDFNKAEMVKAFILSSEYRSRFGSS